MTAPPTSVRRRALLIGSPVDGLRGVAADIEAMRTELAEWGFELVELTNSNATREGIFGELRNLSAWAKDERASVEDAVVIYYSGHGGRCCLVEREGAPPGPAWGFLVPFDIDTGGEFRGIAELELAGILDDLSQQPPSVTVILDCCYSATLARDTVEVDPDLEVIRALPQRSVMPSTLEESLHESLRELARRPREPDPDGNPDVVRVVATSQGYEAYEDRRPGKAPAGYLTTELCAALAEARTIPSSWEAIIARVRERVFQRRGSTLQRPEVEGPRRRLPFSRCEPAYDGERNALVHGPDGAPWLRAGRLHGLCKGDPVTLPGMGSITGTITEVFDDAARLELHPSMGPDMPRAGDMVVPRGLATRRTVHVDRRAQGVAGLLDGLESSLRLTVVENGHDGDFGVALVNDRLEVSGRDGLRRLPQPATAEGVAAVVADLDGLARSQILLAALESPPGLAKGREPLLWTVEVFVTEPGGTSPQALEHGKPLRPGTRIYAQLRHLSRGLSPLYVNVLDRWVGGRVELVNRSEPAGVQLLPEETRWVGRRRYGDKLGLRLDWPDLMPHEEIGAEELIFVVSQRPLDLRSLLEGPWSDRDGSGEPRAGSVAAELETPLRWTVERVRFSVGA